MIDVFGNDRFTGDIMANNVEERIGFPHVLKAAGQAPLTCTGWVQPAYHQEVAILEDNDINADERCLSVLPTYSLGPFLVIVDVAVAENARPRYKNKSSRITGASSGVLAWRQTRLAY